MAVPIVTTNAAQPREYPTVSVIVPIYNGEADVPELVERLLGQTYPADRVEFLLVDNGSGDRGLEGLAVDQPQRALRANTVEEYVGAIAQLFDQPALRATLSARGCELIETIFTWERAGQAYETVLRSRIEA